VFFFSLTAVHGLFLNTLNPSADPAGISPVKLYSETGMAEVFVRWKIFCSLLLLIYGFLQVSLCVE
jgi:hypothetical protein